MFKSVKTVTFFVSFSIVFGIGLNPDRITKNSEEIKPAPKSKWLSSLNGNLGLKSFGSSPVMGFADINYPGPVMLEKPLAVKGIYLTGYCAGSKKIFDQTIAFISKTEINALVIDIKDERGNISFPSSVPLAAQINAGYRKFDPVQVMMTLKKFRIYPIARIVVFKDPYLAGKRPDLAVKNKNGGLWQDYKGLYWVDPYNKKVWEYNVAIAKEAAKFGFKEVQFDYVRFTSDGQIKDCCYPGVDGRAKSDVIRDFLKYAHQELSPLGIQVSADVFGLTCSVQGDIGIGQIFEKIADGVDIICPMVYPSHYVKGSFQIPNPDLKPYETVYRSLSDAQKKVANLNKKITIRPWLQDFSLGNHYGREQLLAQINAVKSAGLKEWIFWNPTNKYDISKYRLKSEIPDDEKFSNVYLNPKQNPLLSGL
jgi:hypothetical protein